MLGCSLLAMRFAVCRGPGLGQGGWFQRDYQVFSSSQAPFHFVHVHHCEGDLEQIRRDYRGLEIKMKDMGGQVMFSSILQLKGQVSGMSC